MNKQKVVVSSSHLETSTGHVEKDGEKGFCVIVYTYVLMRIPFPQKVKSAIILIYEAKPTKRKPLSFNALLQPCNKPKKVAKCIY